MKCGGIQHSHRQKHIRTHAFYLKAKDWPLSTAEKKQYFYHGDLLFEAKDTNIYDSATMVLADGVQPMKLKPVDVARMLKKNCEAMFMHER